MVVARTFRVAIASCAVLTAAACVSTRTDLTTSADRLERNAHVMAQDAREDAGFPTGFSRDAHLLADDAREFRHVVQERGTNDLDVKTAFERVSRSYHAVRDDADHSDSRLARDDLRPVTESYLDVEKAMGGYPARDTRLSSDR
jgi:hypothetical protein